MQIETESLILAGRRARLFDHNGNRGNEAEQTLIAWLRKRVEPQYTISSGEIIDSFGTEVELKSRQQDAILHANTLEARRFVLPSGLVLVPVEAVAAVIEVKLSLDKSEYESAARAAGETGALRLSIDQVKPVAGWGGPISDQFTAGPEEGIRADQSDEGRVRRVAFGMFGFEGPQIETIAKWLRDVPSTLEHVCCLGQGAVFRPAWSAGVGLSFIAPKEHALLSFLQFIDKSVERHRQSARHWRTKTGRYHAESEQNYWDATGYMFPDAYNPSEEEIARVRSIGLLPPDWLPPSKRPAPKAGPG